MTNTEVIHFRHLLWINVTCVIYNMSMPSRKTFNCQKKIHKIHRLYVFKVSKISIWVLLLTNDLSILWNCAIHGTLRYSSSYHLTNNCRFIRMLLIQFNLVLFTLFGAAWKLIINTVYIHIEWFFIWRQIKGTKNQNGGRKTTAKP